MRPLILVLVLATACGSKKQDEPCDMSSDDKVAAIYERLTGHEPDAECIRRTAFEQLAYASVFADDAGCIDEVQIWKCKRSTEKDDPAILQAAGWKTTDNAGREKLARDWLAIGGHVMWTANAEAEAVFAKAGKTFTPPKLTHDAGKVRVDAWFDYGHVSVAGEIPDYRLGAVELDADGKIKHHPTTDQFQ